MPAFPHSALFIAPTRTVLISGPHIQILNTLTGDLLFSTALWKGHDRDDLLKSGPVRCASTDKSQIYLATAGDDKILKVWELDGLKLLSQRELPKRPTAIRFTQDARNILVSDKFGDIFSYDLHPTSLVIPPSSKRDAHKCQSGGTLILGHVSLLTTFLLTFDENYVITADRDEHIRVSCFPHGYDIEKYCLGHKKYVSAIHIPPFLPSLLVSGGGDWTLKFWDWMEGITVHEVDISNRVEPYIIAMESTNTKSPNKNQSNDLEKIGNIVLVIHKIDTVSLYDGNNVIFSVVGATALFAFPYPGESQQSAFRVFDFGYPVLNFVVVDGGYVWTLLDGGWINSSNIIGGGKMVRVVKVTDGGFQEVHDDCLALLLSSLNSICLIPADLQDLQTLDLYSELISMPKNNEIEHNPMDRELLLNNDRTKMQQGNVTNKVLGRLKSKTALLTKAPETEKPGMDNNEREKKRKKGMGRD